MTLTAYPLTIRGEVVETNDFGAIGKIKQFSPTRAYIEQVNELPDTFIVTKNGGIFYKVKI